MSKYPNISGGLLTRNVFLSFIGQIAPLVVAVATMPYVIHGLGAERFGILSLAWVIFGYFNLFNFGLGRATAKFVAEAWGKGMEEQIPPLVWTSLAVNVVLGGIGGAVMTVVTSILTERVLNIPPNLLGETKSMFYVLSFSLPVVMCYGVLKSVLEATQRFDWVNVIKVPASSVTYLIPALGVVWDFDLAGITFMLLIARFVTLLVYLALCFRVFPDMKSNVVLSSGVIVPLMTFGGWVTVASIVIPVLLYLDRFLIGILLSMGAVTFYTTPYELVSKLQILPTSFALVIFPALSALVSVRKDDFERIYARSLKYLLLFMGPMVLILILFAHDLLQLWLGAEFATESARVLQILALGVLINALAQMPANLLDGIGRPDLRAKIFALILPPYCVFLWLLIGKFGIVGAALAWALRACIELAVLFGIAWKLVGLRAELFIKNGVIVMSIIIVGLAVVVSFINAASDGEILARLVLMGVSLVVFALVSWRFALDVADKRSLLMAIGRWKG